MSTATMLQQPTIDGKVDGIIGLDPVQLQCRECAAVVIQDRRSVATFILLSGFHFHVCERHPHRLCPGCLSAAKAACPLRRCAS